ncbi:MAG: 8-oxoguanine DNA glycosylase [Verrucomicrobiae bacterium]|nr:8-oxoguanine DNA glycosylase [Verrucomicrobiae bacterium]
MEIAVDDLRLDHTLESGQAFRWTRRGDGDYEGVVGRCVVRATQHDGKVVLGGASEAVLRRYFQLDADLAAIVRSFPDDPPMRRAVAFCRGLRLLRQEPWETLASFICSSTKQIVQIRQIVAHLCRELGEPLGSGACHAFPSVAAVARATEARLRACKLGFRAAYLRASARMIEAGRVRLDAVGGMDYPRAVEELTKLPGVGPKLADCALLFAWGRQEAFPMDVWIERALRRLYFPGKPRVTRRELAGFTRTHFGPHAGYAQQYLFHYVRRHPQVLEANA